MALKRVLTVEIKNDFEMIFNYIAFILFNPTAAENLINRFHLAIQNACNFPNIYPQYKSYRKIVVDNYLMFYKMNKEQDTLIFHRAIYGGMDYPRFI